MPADTSDFAEALTAIAAEKEAADVGSGVAWLTGLRSEIALDMLDRDSPLITSTGLNGKSDAFLHDITRAQRLAAIRVALANIGVATGARRVTYPSFRRTRFH